jgi:hypothetical protein
MSARVMPRPRSSRSELALKLGEGRLKCPILGPGKADVLEQVHNSDLRKSRRSGIMIRLSREGVTAAPAAFSRK